jgi:hypothetical protein
VPATRQIIGVGPTTRVSAMDRVYSTPPFMYIKEHTENTEQTTRHHTAVLTQPSIDESQIELFDSYDPVLHLKLATQLITDYLSLFQSIVRLSQ